jgi:hypothetical protein
LHDAAACRLSPLTIRRTSTKLNACVLFQFQSTKILTYVHAVLIPAGDTWYTQACPTAEPTGGDLASIT